MAVVPYHPAAIKLLFIVIFTLMPVRVPVAFY